jgi:hypothetical protein
MINVAGQNGQEREHGWSTRSLAGDYLRAGAGFAVTFPPLLFVEWTPAVIIILGGLSGLFLWLGVRTFGRQRTRLSVDQDTITRGRQKISWAQLQEVKLRRYGARKKKGSGYFELLLAGPGGRIKIDSEISDFLDLARHTHEVAHDNHITLDEHSRANFSALGFDR